MRSFVFVWASGDASVDPTVSTVLKDGLSDQSTFGQHSNCVYVASNQTFIDDNELLMFDARLDHRSDLARKLGLPSDSSDASLLTAAWRRWGQDCAKHLYGDFVLLVFSPKTQRLFAVRDALGVRPLFYLKSAAGVFGLASSAAALAELGIVPKALDDRALWMWLQGGYDDRIVMYRDIHGLDWGHQLLVDRGQLQIQRYWQPERLSSIHYNKPEDYVSHFLETFDACVRSRLPSVQSVASMLSGGMDSTSVTASAAIALGKDAVHPISFQFPTMPECDESDLSIAVAQGLGLQPTLVNHEPHWYLKGVLGDGKRRENPFVCWESLENEMMALVRGFGSDVLLTGHGGDNLTAGIDPRHVLGGALYHGEVSMLGRLAREHGVRWQRSFWRYLLAPRLPWQLARRLRPPTLQKPPEWIPGQMHERWYEVASFLKRGERYFDAPDRQSVYNLVAVGADGVRRVCHYYYWHRDAYGVDVRHPFFDRALAELVIRFPAWVMRMGEMPKGLLRIANQGRLPESVLEKVQKTSLLSFYHKGVQCEQNHVKCLMERSVLADKRYVDKQALLKRLEHYLSSVPGTVYATFGPVLMLENWLQSEGLNA